MSKKKQQYVSFQTTEKEKAIVRKIHTRIHRLMTEHGKRISDDRLQTIIMDIVAAHCNGCPLRLAELLKADDFNFMHDVYGINNTIDRTNGQLQKFFHPRFSVSRADIVNPWGNKEQGYSLSVEDRLQKIKSMSMKDLHKVLAYPGNQKTVDAAIRRQIAGAPIF